MSTYQYTSPRDAVAEALNIQAETEAAIELNLTADDLVRTYHQGDSGKTPREFFRTPVSGDTIALLTRKTNR